MADTQKTVEPDSPTDQEMVNAAQNSHIVSDGILEIDEPADGNLEPIVSRGGDNGAYVRAWLWVDYDDAITLAEENKATA